MARRRKFPWILVVIALLAVAVFGKLKLDDRLSDHVE
jgi:Tfp pilus assembly protein PilX